MKTIIKFSTIALLFLSSVAQANVYSNLPDCKNRRGDVLDGSIEEIHAIMNSRQQKPMIYVTGVVEKILPEDHIGLPHQLYIMTLAAGKNTVKFRVVSNLDFGRVPLQIGQKMSVCGEYKKIKEGNLLHWTHFDPRGNHPDGFTIYNDVLYGDQETSNRQERQNF